MKNKQQSNSITLNLIWQFVPLWKIHLCRGHCDSKPDQSLTFSNQSQAFSSLFLRLFLWPKPQTFCSLSPFSHSYRSLSLSLHSSRWLSFHTTRKLGIANLCYSDLDVHSQIPSVSIQCEDEAFIPFSSYQVTVLPAPPAFVSSACSVRGRLPDLAQLPVSLQATVNPPGRNAEMQKHLNGKCNNVYRAVCRQKVFRQFSQIIRKDTKLQSMGQTPNYAKYRS